MSDDQDFTNLFGTDDEASDIDDGRSQSSHDSQPANRKRQQTIVGSDNDDVDDGSDAILYKRQKNSVNDLFGSSDEDEDTQQPPPSER
jgi:RNA polymerase-associated protein LEO1